MNAASRPTVAVLFGGRSSEHEVSCATAGGVLGAIDRDRWNVVAVGITREGRWVPVSADPDQWRIRDGALPHVPHDERTVLPPRDASERTWRVLGADGTASALADVHVVLPLLHGPFGEDGTIQGALELIDVRYVGSGVLASAVGMDKAYMKIALRAAGLPVTPDVVLAPGESPDGRRAEIEALGMPVFVKPARAGSSMGISKVSEWSQLDAAVAAAVKHDPKVLIEQAVVGREIETAVLDGPQGAVASPAGEIVTGAGREFYDFEAKYLDDEAVDLRCPTELADDVAAQVADMALRSFAAVGAESLARVDVFVGDDGTVTVNEINTMPGFTATSMYPRMWAAAGVSYPELIETLLTGALERATGLR
ncbi:D-alanine--D-alanine ligase family protein [Demequina muriae]|uniref:D-alanine--D-alanine ligase n=1 Tax=Demequina muriae TaxID=3051664 RepID=A0ABT8GIR6_9MICO|nr:D-alanine--D-alanine ligase family protein [Demequina sp. EGI L300058]MDN4481322.1 D-alanine--D-alanine ligase family protein [Demequina sp. EGI L300058]